MTNMPWQMKPLKGGYRRTEILWLRVMFGFQSSRYGLQYDIQHLCVIEIMALYDSLIWINIQIGHDFKAMSMTEPSYAEPAEQTNLLVEKYICFQTIYLIPKRTTLEANAAKKLLCITHWSILEPTCIKRCEILSMTSATMQIQLKKYLIICYKQVRSERYVRGMWV